jgi:voltage-gated potassium channel
MRMAVAWAAETDVAGNGGALARIRANSPRLTRRPFAPHHRASTPNARSDPSSPAATMTHSPLVWLGLGGVPPEDNAVAHHWQARLHWLMVAIALMSVPAYLLATAELNPVWHEVSSVLDFVIVVAFAAELVWMMHVSSHPWRYFFENWLNVVIIAGAAAAAFGAATEWIAVVRAMRAAVALLVVLRAAAEFRFLFTRKGAPMLLGLAFLTMLALGALFFWLDPAIKTFWDGLWLAFITGATVGYGDVVPTTAGTRILAVLTVLIGVALMTLFTANVVTFFIGGEETRNRESLQHDIVRLRAQIEKLLDAEELRITLELHREIRALRGDLAEVRGELRALQIERRPDAADDG